jgi:hypothetical protein
VHPEYGATVARLQNGVGQLCGLLLPETALDEQLERARNLRWFVRRSQGPHGKGDLVARLDASPVSPDVEFHGRCFAGRLAPR